MDARKYQTECVESILGALRRGIHPAISLFTGAGKTFIAKMLVQALPADAKILFLVNQTNLAHQAAEELGCYNIMGDGQMAELHKRLTIGVIQTVGKLNALPFTHIIFDELHRSHCPLYYGLIENCPQAHRIGLSATIMRGDGRALSHIFDEVVFHKNLHDGVAEGWLVPYRVIRPSNASRLPVEKVIVLNGTDQIEKDNLNCPERNQIMANLISSTIWETGRRCTIGFANTIAHCRAMAALLPGFGVVSGSDQSDLARLKAGKLIGVFSSQLLLEGFNHPPVDHIAVCGSISQERGGVRATQLLGRALRTCPPHKTDAVVLDLSPNGLPEFILDPDLSGIDAMAQTIEKGELGEGELVISRRIVTHQLTAENFSTRMETMTSCEASGFDGVLKLKDEVYYFRGSDYTFRIQDGKFILANGTSKSQFASFNDMQRFIKRKPMSDFERRKLEKQGLPVDQTSLELLRWTAHRRPASPAQLQALINMGIPVTQDITFEQSRKILARAFVAR